MEEVVAAFFSVTTDNHDERRMRVAPPFVVFVDAFDFPALTVIERFSASWKSFPN
jgi:hypothetical protein